MNINMYHKGDDGKIFEAKSVPIDGIQMSFGKDGVAMTFSSHEFDLQISEMDIIDLETIQSTMKVWIWELEPIFDADRKCTLIGMGNNQEEALQSIVKQVYRENSKYSLADIDKILRMLLVKSTPKICRAAVL